ncbi:MAG TPA: class I SAM-dependent methyltransferase [Actinomycetota bacterium]|nr:class I SAM-dependent methyltransferase [Actinomycetota bacterium]
MKDVHRSAAIGFDKAAEVYERARPGYPIEAIDFVVEQLGDGPYVDVAAGTGKLTRELVARGLDVIAVEPVQGMRRTFASVLPGVPILAGTAESLPFDDHSIGGITAAQAAHWFDAARAVQEFHRVLKPGGRIALLWNARDESFDWVRRVTEIIDPYERMHGTPRYKHGAWRPPFDESPLIKPVGQRRFAYAQPMTMQGFLDRFNSCSFIAVLDDSAKAEVIGKLRDLVRTHPDLAGRERFEQPYVTEVYVYEAV